MVPEEGKPGKERGITSDGVTPLLLISNLWTSLCLLYKAITRNLLGSSELHSKLQLRRAFWSALSLSRPKRAFFICSINSVVLRSFYASAPVR